MRKKLFLLRWREEFKKAAEGEEQRVLVAVFDACSGQEIGADHLQTVTS